MKKIFIAGRTIFSKKSFYQILINFFGLNFSSLKFISGINGLNLLTSLDNVPQTYIHFLNNILRLNFIILKILHKKYVLVLRFEKRLGSYRGLRLNLGLPNRGQRTHSNAKTARKRFFS